MSKARSILPFSEWGRWFNEHPDYDLRSLYSPVPPYITRVFGLWPVLSVSELLSPPRIRALVGGEPAPHRVALLLRLLRLVYRNTILPLLAAVSVETEELTLQNFYFRHLYIASDSSAFPTNDASGLVVVRTKRNEARLELKITLFQLAPGAPSEFTASSLLTDWSVLWSDEAFARSEILPHFSTNIGLGAPITAMQADVFLMAGTLMLQELTPGLMEDKPWQFPTRASIDRALSRIRLDLPRHEALADIIQNAGSRQSFLEAILWLQDEVVVVFKRLQRSMRGAGRLDDPELVQYTTLAREQFFIDLSIVKDFDNPQRDFIRNFLDQFWFARTFEIASAFAKEEARLADLDGVPSLTDDDADG